MHSDALLVERRLPPCREPVQYSRIWYPDCVTAGAVFPYSRIPLRKNLIGDTSAWP
jgi:hypothetical protein